LGNTKELLDDFEERLGTEVRQQVGEERKRKKKGKSIEEWSYQEIIWQSCCINGTTRSLRRSIWKS